MFTVVDYGAGPGTLARGILAASPQCLDALRYIAVEQSADQRALHPDSVMSLAELTPEVVGNGVVGVVLANELLDNLAFGQLLNTDGVLLSGVVDEHNGDLRHHFASEPSPELMEVLARSGDLSERILFDQSAAAEVVASILDGVLLRGRLIVIDYARLRSEEVEVRTYQEHGRAGDPLRDLGTKDITVDVDLEQLQARTRPADAISTQARWLEQHGIDELVEEGRRVWKETASIGDLSALRFRSRIREAEALLASDGLGGFYVAEWITNP